MSEVKTSQPQQHEHVSGASSPGAFVAGLLFGGLAGAGAMLLLAPQSGKRTRAQIHQKGDELREETTETVEDAASQVRAKVHRFKVGVRKEAKSLKRQGQELLDEQAERISAAVEDVKEAVHAS